MRNRVVIFFVFSFLFLLTFSSCSSYRFSKGGIMVKDVDRYFNPALQTNVWLYMDFEPNEKSYAGVRLRKLHQEDSPILRKFVDINSSDRILFSSKSSNKSPYHLLAIYHKNRKIDLSKYKRIAVKEGYYYQSDSKEGRLDIRHVIIPYGHNEALSLVNYVSAEQHIACKFCRLDYLVKINTKELQQGDRTERSWKISDSDGLADKSVLIPIDKNLVMRYDEVFLNVLADYGADTGIIYFKILDKNNSDDVQISLSPNTYYIEYTNKKNKLLKIDSIVVE